MAIGVTLAPVPATQAEPATQPAAVCYEDQPCWDCRHTGNLTCGEGAVLPDGSTALPGWYGDSDCWPGAIWCPDTDGPYDPAVVHPDMLKLHTWVDDGQARLRPRPVVGGGPMSDDTRAVLTVRVLFEGIADAQAAATLIESQVTKALAIESSIEEV